MYAINISMSKGERGGRQGEARVDERTRMKRRRENKRRRLVHEG